MRRPKQPKTDHDHEAEVLAMRFARSRDHGDFRRLYNCMRVTVESEAKDSASGDKVLESELLAVALKALDYAARTWDQDRGRKFTTYAKMCMRSRFVDAARWRKRQPGQSIDPEDDETVEEYIDRNAIDDGAENCQVENIEASIRLASVKSAWSQCARHVDNDDRELFDGYVAALIEGNRLSPVVGRLVLSKASTIGQMLLFAHESGQVALRDDAYRRCLVMFEEDGWAAATLLLQGYTVAEAGVELSLPSSIVKAMLDCVKTSAQQVLIDGVDQTAA